MNNTVTTPTTYDVTASTTNDEIREYLANNQAFLDGEVVLAGVEPTSNNDVVSLIFVQNRTDLPSTNNNMALSLSMGWKNLPVTVRTFHNANIDVFKQTDSVPGDTAKSIFSKLAEINEVDLEIESVDIAVIDSTEPNTWIDSSGVTHQQKPLMTKAENALTYKGQFIYRTTQLSINNSIETSTLKPDKIVVLK